MPICRKCKEEKGVFYFPFIEAKRSYADICKTCRNKNRCKGECERLRKGWDALLEINPFKKKKVKRR